jgi:hypothetical protein
LLDVQGQHRVAARRLRIHEGACRGAVRVARHKGSFDLCVHQQCAREGIANQRKKIAANKLSFFFFLVLLYDTEA